MTATPLEARGGIWLKRDDLFEVGGAPGGKARTCLALLAGAEPGELAITASARTSPQALIVAALARHLGLRARCHMPAAGGEPTPEMRRVAELGAEIIEHRPGYNTVIVARAREDAAGRSDATLIPFGMECEEAVEQTAGQVPELPAGCRRIVVAVGSGMSAAGILRGLERSGQQVPLLGVVVGADPSRRLERYAPGWRQRLRLVPAGVGYGQKVEGRGRISGVVLDPIYEAKAVAWLRPGDLFWIVGIRAQLPAGEALAAA